MRRLLLLLLPTLALAFGTGCGDPCEKLAKKICDEVKDPKACERSRKDMEDFSEEVCAHALTIFDKLQEK